MADHLTMAQAAAVAGVTRSGLRSVLARARAAGVELEAPRAAWPDARTPLVDAAALDAYLAGRPRGRKISRELQSRAVPAPAARPEDFPSECSDPNGGPGGA